MWAHAMSGGSDVLPHPRRRRVTAEDSGMRPSHIPMLCVIALATMTCAPRALASATIPSGLELTKNCTLVGAHDASAILGTGVEAFPPETQAGGVCSFSTGSVMQQGVVSYAVVTQPDVVARAGFFLRLARRCGNVDPRAPNAAQCATYRKLIDVTTPQAYFEARSGTPDAVAQALGDKAVSNATAVYVLRGGEVFECVVRPDETLDVDRSIALANMLLARVAPIEAP